MGVIRESAREMPEFWIIPKCQGNSGKTVYYNGNRYECRTAHYPGLLVHTVCRVQGASIASYGIKAETSCEDVLSQCNCEHIVHFPEEWNESNRMWYNLDKAGHSYMNHEKGLIPCEMVGNVCYSCANSHMREFRLDRVIDRYLD